VEAVRETPIDKGFKVDTLELDRLFHDYLSISVSTHGVHIGRVVTLPFKNNLALIDATLDVIRLSLFKRIRSNVNGVDMLSDYEYDVDFCGADQVLYCKIVRHFCEKIGHDVVLRYLFKIRQQQHRDYKILHRINAVINECYQLII